MNTRNRLQAVIAVLALIFAQVGAARVELVAAVIKKPPEEQAKTKSAPDTQEKKPGSATGKKAKDVDPGLATENERDPRVFMREQALHTLRYIVSEADGIEDIKDQIHVKCRAAAALWDDDIERARKEFLSMPEIIEAYRSESLKPEHLRSLREILWRELLQEAFRCDRRLASRLQKVKAEKDRERDTVRSGDQAGRRAPADDAFKADMLARMAMEVLEENAARAFELVKESIDTGVGSPLIANLLIPLRMALGSQTVDPQLHRYLVLQLQRPSISAASVNVLAAYIFPDLQMGAAKTQSTATPAVAGSMIRLFCDLTLVVLAQVTKRLENLTAPSAANAVQLLSNQSYTAALRLKPKFAQYAPDRVEPLSSLIQQLGARLQPKEREVSDAINEPQQGVSEFLKRAEEESTSSARDIHYSQAAAVALAAGDYDAAEGIVGRITGPDLKRALYQQISQGLVQAHVKRGELDDALASAERLEPAERGVALSVIGAAAATTGDIVRARSILAWAEQVMGQMENSVEKVNKLVHLGNTYQRIEPEKAFEVLAAAIFAANRAFDTSGKAVKISATGAAGTVTLPDENVRVTGLFSLDSLFQQLATRDYIRATAQAETLERRELRLSARLAVARGILSSERRAGSGKPK